MLEKILINGLFNLLILSGLRRDIACMNTYLGQSTDRLDRIAREIIDIERFNRQSGQFFSTLCNQTTVSSKTGFHRMLSIRDCHHFFNNT